jgi:hypothetical protein
MMLEDLEYLGTCSSGVVKPGFVAADVTQGCRSSAFVEHHDPLRSVCLHQTKHVHLEQGGHIAVRYFFPSLHQGGDEEEVGFYLLVQNTSE